MNVKLSKGMTSVSVIYMNLIYYNIETNRNLPSWDQELQFC